MIRFIVLIFLFSPHIFAAQVVVGSKIFTESYVLSEIAAQSIENATGKALDRKLGLGSTGMVFESLKTGAIDVYPDYSGTLAETLLKNPNLKNLSDIRNALVPFGLTISESLGFNDTYALAMREDFAEANHLESIGDLRAVTGKIRAAFSYEFMDRKDGYKGLIERYGLNLNHVSQMEHSLVYSALQENAVDIIEVYSTDANIKKYNLRVLKDDRNYFPSYQAVWVARLAFVKSHPDEWQILRKLEGTINEEKMRSLNAMADIEKKSVGQIASEYLHSTDLGAKGDTFKLQSRYDQILQRTGEHLWLVGIALLFAIFIGVPLGVIATRFRASGQVILLLSSLVQTIPALALLCFLIPVFGVGLKPALVALCLYSLLPVVLNTFTGILSIEDRHIENAKAFGLNQVQVLTRIILPMASPTIIAGVKTATIVSIGTATLAALIGAGGYGALIVSGLSLNDIPTILAGAIPAAVMALAAHFIFAGLSKILVPRGLQKTRV